MNTQLQDRLAALRIDVPADVADRHLEQIAVVLAEPPVPARVHPGGLRRRAAGLRARAATIAAAVALVGTPAAAVAAESAVPGDVLYPVKQVTELVRSWFDDTIEADHRIDELETVIDRRADSPVIADRLQDAEDAVTDLADPQVTDRLDRVRDRIRDEAPRTDEEPSVTDEPRPSDRPTDGATTTTTHADRPTDATSTTTTSTTTSTRPPDDRGHGDDGSGTGSDAPPDEPPRGDRRGD